MALSSFVLQQRLEVAPDAYVFKLGCSCNGRVLAAATSEHTICALDAATMSPIQTLSGHNDMVEDLSFFLDSPACLASCSQDGSARIWDLRAGDSSSRHFAVSSNEAYSCSVGQGDKALACAASEKIHIFDIAQGKRFCTYKDCHSDVVNHIRFHPLDATKLISGAEDNLAVLLDTSKAREEEAMLGVIPNEESVRSFTLLGPGRNTLCCQSTTEDVRIFSLGQEDFGSRTAEFLGIRDHSILMGEESGGYIVETFYDEPSGQVLLLAGSGTPGDLVLFSVTETGPSPVACFAAPEAIGHNGIVRSAVCAPGSFVVTAGEDGCVCVWKQQQAGEGCGTGDEPGGCLALEPTAYGAQRAGDGAARAAPY